MRALRIATVGLALNASACTLLLSSDSDPPGAALELRPGSVDFEQLVVGQMSTPVEFTVLALKDNDALVVELVGTEAGFAVESDGCSDEPLLTGEVCRISVTFTAMEPQQVDGRLTVGDASAGLEGAGIAIGDLRISPTAFDFVATLVGETSVESAFTITNVGEGAIREINIETPASFPVGANTCAEVLLTNAAPCNFTVAFHPMAPGPLTTSVVVEGNGGEVVTAASISGDGLVKLDLVLGGDGGQVTVTPASLIPREAVCVSEQSNCSYAFELGTTVNLEQNVSRPWQGDCAGAGQERECQIVMDGNKTVTLNFGGGQ